MEIRPYQESDESDVVALWKACDLVKPWNDPRKDIQRKLGVDGELFLVGVVDDRVIATVMGGYEGHRGWINYLAVDPSCRRNGYGTRIVHVVERLISAKGCPKINLQIRTSNAEAVTFYEALGYLTDDVIGLGKRLVSDDS